MRKNPFWYFRFNQLWLFIFQFGCRPKSTNSIILVFAHTISNIKIDLERSRLRESMVKKHFLYFECHTFEILCDSSSPPRAKMRPMTLEKFLKHGFSFFHQILPFSFESRLMWYFSCLIYKNMHSPLKNYFYLKWEKILSHEEELVFEKIQSVESILSQFFIQSQFSCVILTNQIFMNFIFHIVDGDLRHDRVRNLRLESP